MSINIFCILYVERITQNEPKWESNTRYTHVWQPSNEDVLLHSSNSEVHTLFHNPSAGCPYLPLLSVTKSSFDYVFSFSRPIPLRSTCHDHSRNLPLYFLLQILIPFHLTFISLLFPSRVPLRSAMSASQEPLLEFRRHFRPARIPQVELPEFCN